MSNMFFFAVSFASLGFISLYMAGKLGVFNDKGRGQSLRLLVSLLPLLIALTVALSRTCDYHHHWQGIDKQKTHPHFVLLFFLTKLFFFSFPGKKKMSFAVPYWDFSPLTFAIDNIILLSIHLMLTSP